MFGIIFSVLIGIVIYAGLTDYGVDHSVAVAFSLAIALVSSFVFHAYLAWEDQSGARRYHRRKLGNRRNRW